MFGFFTGLSLLGRIGTAGGVLIAVIAAYWFWHHTVYNRGYDAAIAAIAAENKEAVDAADRARQKVRACADSGGNWDVTGGVCVR